MSTQKQLTPEQAIDMPIKSVNKSDTIEDRFTDNTLDNIFPARYLKRNDDGEIIETPEEMFERVSNKVAQAEFQWGDEDDYEEWASKFKEVMVEQRAMPNSPALMNMGNRVNQGSACFVRSPDDSMEDIFEAAKDWGLIQKTGGGIGGAFHKLRPKGAIIRSTRGRSSGPISFMKLFNQVAGTVKQGGKRRGAQMAILRVDHADVGRFATAKRNEGDFSNFNICVALSDEFIESLENDEQYTFYDSENDFTEPQMVLKETAHFYSPEYEDMPKTLVDENLWRDYNIQAMDDGELVSLREKWEDDERIHIEEGDVLRLPAEFVLDIMIDGAWRNGEPGFVHYDEMNRQHSFDVSEHPEYKIESTNPCSEQPLTDYESCNLMHVNLSLIVEEGAPTFDEYVSDYEYDTTQAAARDYFNDAIDKDSLKEVVQVIVRFLDDMIDVSDFPLQANEDRISSTRKIGVGVMGWAQLLYQTGIKYGSPESIQLARITMAHIDAYATEYSHELAKERGPFDEWEKTKWAQPEAYPKWFNQHAHQHPEDWEDGYPVRNHNHTTVAPTGTTSLIADTSGGIEPVYNVAYKKNVGEDIQGDDMLVEFDSFFLEALEQNNLDVEEIKDIASKQMRNNEFEGVSGLPDLPKELKETFVTTEDISPEEHVDMQRAFQEFVDSGLSKTINLPEGATRDDVRDAYLRALKQEGVGDPAKGTTVYRDQSREEQVLTTQEYSDMEVENAVEMLRDLDGYSVEVEE